MYNVVMYWDTYVQFCILFQSEDGPLFERNKALKMLS